MISTEIILNYPIFELLYCLTTWLTIRLHIVIAWAHLSRIITFSAATTWTEANAPIGSLSNWNLRLPWELDGECRVLGTCS